MAMATILPLIKSTIIRTINTGNEDLEDDYNLNDITSSNKNNNKVVMDKEWECTLYLAPSTIPNGGLGLFTTRAFHEKNIDLSLYDVTPDIVIPFGVHISDEISNTNHDDGDGEWDEAIISNHHAGGIENYYWHADSYEPINNQRHYLTQQYEGNAFSYYVVSTGGTLPNHDVYYENIQPASSTSVRDDDDNTNPSTSKHMYGAVDQIDRPHPGSDAYTPFHHIALQTTKSIDIGDELFLNYGESYFGYDDEEEEEDNDEHYYSNVPTLETYARAQTIMQQFKKSSSHTINNFTDTTTLASTNILSSLYLMSNTSIQSLLQSKWDDILNQVTSSQCVKDQRMFSVLPKDVRTVMIDVSHNDTKMNNQTMTSMNREEIENDTMYENDDNSSEASMMNHKFALWENKKSKEWIETNGVCLNKIRVGAPSYMLEAGRGMFANTFFEKGEVIAPVPVIQVNRTLQELHHTMSHGGASSSSAADHRLLLNYCFGHSESTLLLCPYNNVVLINHGRTCDGSTTCGTDGKTSHHYGTANAKLIFSLERSSGTSLNMDLLEMSPHELLTTLTPMGVVYDIIATRDIMEGDEILLDYGTRWEEEWASHLEKWKPFVSHLEKNETIPTIVGNNTTCDQDGDAGEKNKRQEDGSSTARSVLPKCVLEDPNVKHVIFHSPSIKKDISNSNNKGKEPSDVNNVMIMGCYYLPDWSLVQNVTELTINEQTIGSNDTRNNTTIHMLPWKYATDRTFTLGSLYPCVVLFEQREQTQELSQHLNEPSPNHYNNPVHHIVEELNYTVLMLLDYNAETDGLNNINEPPLIQVAKDVPHEAIRHVSNDWRQLKAVNYSHDNDGDIINEPSHKNSLNNDTETGFRNLTATRMTKPISPKAFRHYMELPNNLFPLKWRDLAF